MSRSIIVFTLFDSLSNLFCFLSTLKPQILQLLSPCVQCLSAVAMALPPDHMEQNCLSHIEKITSIDTDGHFDPQPVDTSK